MGAVRVAGPDAQAGSLAARAGAVDAGRVGGTAPALAGRPAHADQNVVEEGDVAALAGSTGGGIVGPTTRDRRRGAEPDAGAGIRSVQPHTRGLAAAVGVGLTSLRAHPVAGGDGDTALPRLAGAVRRAGLPAPAPPAAQAPRTAAGAVVLGADQAG